MRKTVLLLASMGIAVLLAFGLAVGVSYSAANKRPNIILLMTDDQSTDTLWSMTRVRKLLAGKGTTLTNAHFAYPRCCPSRATILKGQYPHNTGLFRNREGADYFRNRGLDRSTVAVWLDKVGYDTALIGKYLNGYDAPYIPPGWDYWFSQDGGGNSRTVNDNGKIRKYAADTHMDSVRKTKIADYVRQKASKHRPFFLQASFFAPHSPYDHQAKYNSSFASARFPRSPAYDEKDVSDKPKFVRSKPRISQEKTRQYTKYYRDRLRSVQTPDSSVADIVRILAKYGELNNTYIVFWTDNGYHMGEHRLPPGKQTHYGPDSNFPMIVRGPGIRQGVEDDRLVLNTDLAPTFLAWANAGQKDWTDGRPLNNLLDKRSDPASWRKYILLEGRTPDGNAVGMPAYTGILSAKGQKFVRYANGEEEYYDHNTDPYEMANKLQGAPQVLKDQLRVLERCANVGCKRAENGAVR